MKSAGSRNFLVIGAVLLAAMNAYAGGRSDDMMKARLSGFHEVPVNSTTGGGEFRARIDRNSGEINYSLSYAALEGTTTLASHIHLGQANVNGGVAAFLCGGGGKPPCPAVQGTVEGTITAADVIGPTGQGIAAGEFDELLNGIRSGVTYVNVHTNKHPGGEIRGQVKGHDEDN